MIVALYTAAAVIMAVGSLHLACRNRDFRKFLAGAFFVSSGTLLYLYFADVSVPLLGTGFVETPQISAARSVVHFILFLLCFYFGFVAKPKGLNRASILALLPFLRRHVAHYVVPAAGTATVDQERMCSTPGMTSRYNPNMRQTLRPHPDSACSAATHIEVEIARPCIGFLLLSYSVTGNIDAIRISPAMPAGRTDELWRHTCFEAFIRARPCASYYEFNFSPSTQWAAYWFGNYRSGMRVATEIRAPRIEARRANERYTLEASLKLDSLSSLPRNAAWHLGLSALIEETNGRKSYWALAHPPGKPDFHHPVCFAHELSPAYRL